MRKINIFLGSSINELVSERQAFADIISELNTKLRNAGYFIYLDKCEYEDGFVHSESSQSRIDNRIRESTYSYFIIKYRFGSLTEHEFDVALSSFCQTGAPKLSVYFQKISEDELRSPEAIAFQEHLAEMKYYYKEYQHTEELKLNIVLNLAVDDIMLTKSLKAEDGGIYLDDKMLVNLEMLPTYFKHSELKKLHVDLACLEEEELHTVDRKEKRLIREQIAELTVHIREIEDLLFHTMLGLVQAERGEITPLLYRAVSYIEKGEIEKAAEILNVNDVFDELEAYQEKTELSLEGISAAINTAEIAIEMRQQLPASQERSIQIEQLYERIIALEMRYNLNSVHCVLYARHLLKMKKYSKAIEYITIYADVAGRRITNEEDFLGMEYALFGFILDMEPLYQQEKERYQSLLLSLYTCLFNVYWNTMESLGPSMNLNPWELGIFCEKALKLIDDWVGEKDENTISQEKSLCILVDRLHKRGYHKVEPDSLDGKKDARQLIDFLELRDRCNKLNNEPDSDDPETYLTQYNKMMEDLVDYLCHSENALLKDNPTVQKAINDCNLVKTVLQERDEDAILRLFLQVKLAHAMSYLNAANFPLAIKDYQVAYNHGKKLIISSDPIDLYLFLSICRGYATTIVNRNDAEYKDYEDAEKIILEGIAIGEMLTAMDVKFSIPLADIYHNYAAICMNGRITNCNEKGAKYFRLAYEIYQQHELELDAIEKINYLKLCQSYGYFDLCGGFRQSAMEYFEKAIDIIASFDLILNQRYYPLIERTIILALYVADQLNRTDELFPKLRKIYTDEAVESFLLSARSIPVKK